jgi:cation-transporting ATPase E
MPSFLLALEPNYDIVKGDFIKRTLVNALPGGLAIFLCILYMFSDVKDYVGQEFTKLFPHVPTIGIAIALFVYLVTMYFICRPMTNWRKVVFGLVIVMAVGAAMIPPLMKFYGLVGLLPQDYWYTIQFCIGGVAITLVLRFIVRWLVYNPKLERLFTFKPRRHSKN